MTVYDFSDTEGIVRLRGTIAPPIASGLAMTDLGVLHATDLNAGEVTVFAPTAGQFVQITSGALVAGDTGQGLQIGLAGTAAPATNLYARLLYNWQAYNSVTENGWPTPDKFNNYVSDGTAIKASSETLTNAFGVLTAPAAWQALHNYPAAIVIIAGPDHHWWSQTAGGMSGAMIPNFAGNEGGSVVDGAVTWTDEGPIPATGSIHLYALHS